MDNKLTRTAVVGIGGRGIWAVSALKESSQFELVALCDTDQPKLERFKSDWEMQSIPAYTSIADCLANEQLDAVVVTSHDGGHAEVAVPALQAGKFVYLEKPLEITQEKCASIIEADEQAGGKTFVGFNLRFAPMYMKVKELIDQGAVGDILTIQADEFYDGGRTYFRRWNRFRDFGGGLWITKASHDFDILHWMAGVKPLSVYAQDRRTYYTSREDAPLYCAECDKKDCCPDSFYVIARKKASNEKARKKTELKDYAAQQAGSRLDLCLYNSEKDTFDHGIATVTFSQDILATYTCNVVCGFSERRIRVSGTKGTIDGSLQSNAVTLRQRDPSQTEDIPLEKRQGGHGGADSVLFSHFYEFTQGRRQSDVPPTEAATAVMMGLAATRSADEGRRVDMAEFDK